MARDIFQRLKFDNDTMKQVCHLIEFHDYRPDMSPKAIRRAIAKIGPEYCKALFAVKRADIAGQSDYLKQEKYAYVDEFERMFDDMQQEHVCLKKSMLCINGRDLMQLGVPQGKEIGRILDELFERVLEDPSINEREKLMELAHNMITPNI